MNFVNCVSFSSALGEPHKNKEDLVKGVFLFFLFCCLFYFSKSGFLYIVVRLKQGPPADEGKREERAGYCPSPSRGAGGGWENMSESGRTQEALEEPSSRRTFRNRRI